jgi:hypothetical protein
MKKYVVALNTGVEVVDTVKEAQQLLGKAGLSVTQANILKGLVEQAQCVDESEVPAILEAAGQAQEPAKDEVAEEAQEDAASTDAQEGDTKVEDDKQDPTPASTNEDKQDDDIEYPEVGYFKDEKAMKKFYKPLTNAQITEWAELEGVEWKPNEHESINRMRQVMALKAKHFPHLAPKHSAKTKSKYSQYTTEQLVQMALDGEIDVEERSGDMRILRMKTIMALRNAGIIE